MGTHPLGASSNTKQKIDKTGVKHMRKLLFIGVAALLLLPSTVVAGEDHKVFVCKYVGTPGVDERLQTGDNPISVDVHAIPIYNKDDPANDSPEDLVGKSFADAQGRSLVIAVDNGQDEPECPTDEVEPTPTPTPAPTATPTATPELPTPTPTEGLPDAGGGNEPTPHLATLAPTDTAPASADNGVNYTPFVLIALVFIAALVGSVARRTR